MVSLTCPAVCAWCPHFPALQKVSPGPVVGHKVNFQVVFFFLLPHFSRITGIDTRSTDRKPFPRAGTIVVLPKTHRLWAPQVVQWDGAHALKDLLVKPGRAKLCPFCRFTGAINGLPRVAEGLFCSCCEYKGKLYLPCLRGQMRGLCNISVWMTSRLD